MIVKTKRVDNKHVIVQERLADRWDGTPVHDLYLAKALVGGGLEKIPDEEPTIVFRGRDKLALPMLYAYRRLCEADKVTEHQLETLDGMIQAFEVFLIGHPDQMKQPGSTRGR